MGKTCKCVLKLKEIIISFLKLIGKADHFSKLRGSDWLCDFAFFVNVLTHMNELYAKLLGKELFAQDMYTSITVFQSKLALFSAHMSNSFCLHLPALMIKEASKKVNKYSKLLNDLHHKFCCRFLDFEKLPKTFQIILALLSQVAATAPQELQFELIILHSDFVLEKKFKTQKLFYASLNHTDFRKFERWHRKYWYCLTPHIFVNRCSA